MRAGCWSVGKAVLAPAKQTVRAILSEAREKARLAIEEGKFEDARAMADDALRKSVPPIKPYWRSGNVKGSFPGWYARRLGRAMGPQRFNHHRTPPGWSREWLLQAGTTRAHAPTVVSTEAGSETIYSEQPVFGFELPRPWILDRAASSSGISAFQKAHIDAVGGSARYQRLLFLDMLTQELREPQLIAYHTRCEIVVQRMAHGGWGYVRCLFMPLNFNEPAEATPNTMALNNCKCLDCNRRKARLNGYPVPKSDMAYLDARGDRTITYDPR